MRRPWVKVCGITRVEDALAAVLAGAAAVGFVFVPGSPRRVTPRIARAIGERLPRRVARLGVTADLSAEAARILIDEGGLTALQAHGSESPALCATYPAPVVKAFAAGAGFDPARLEAYRRFPVLLDGGVAPGQGGTGSGADWGAARRAVLAGHRVILAGGLGPSNLLEAIRAVEPVAVDLNSALESAPGRKDARRLALAFRVLDGLPEPAKETWPW